MRVVSFLVATNWNQLIYQILEIQQLVIWVIYYTFGCSSLEYLDMSNYKSNIENSDNENMFDCVENIKYIPEIK